MYWLASLAQVPDDSPAPAGHYARPDEFDVHVDRSRLVTAQFADRTADKDL